MRYLLVAVVLLTGCIKRDPVIARVVDAERKYTEEATEYCTHPGYCMACGLGFDGSFKCAARFQYSCPGRRPVVQEVTPCIATHESGMQSRCDQRRTLKTLGACT